MGSYLAFENRVKRGSGAIRNDLGINAAIAFIDTENDRFTVSSTATFTTDPLRTEVRFVELDLSGKRRFALAIKSYRAANQCQISVYRIPV